MCVCQRLMTVIVDSLDDQTVQLVLVLQSIHVAPRARLTLAFMDTRFPQVIELLKRSYKPSEHFDGKTFNSSIQ